MENMMQAQVSSEQTYTPLPLRPHTILGVCEGIGEDFGFNPAWLRIPLAASVVISPTFAIGGYFALGGVVLLSRLLFPRTKPAPVATEQPAPANEQREIAKAA
jgi:phage shock protein PspC (stress-responsive transcriptional regulator)